MPDIGAGMFSVGLASTGGIGTRVGAAFVEVFADVSGLRAGFASAEAMTRNFATRMQVTGAMTARTGALLTRNLSVPLLAIGGASVKMAADFETAMTRTSALAGVAGKDLDQYRESVLALSRETAQAPKDLADALYFVASAGLKTAQIMPVLKMSAQGAAAQMADAATIGHLLTGVLVAYGKEAPTASQAMDVLTAAIREGKAEPEDLASSLGVVVPVAAQMRVGFDELAGAIAAATNVNINAARAATGLRYMLIQLENPTEAAKDALSDYGLTIKDVQRWVEADLVNGLKRLGDTLDLTTAKGKEAFFTIVGGVRSGHVALALAGESIKRTQAVVDETAKAMTDAGNEFDKAYDKMRQTPGFELQKAWNDIKLAAIEIGDILLPVALKVVEAIRSIAEAFAELPDPIQENIVQIAAYAAAFGPLLAVFGRVYMWTGRLINSFRALGAVQGAAGLAGGLGGVGGTMGGVGGVPAAAMAAAPFGRNMALTGYTRAQMAMMAGGAVPPMPMQFLRSGVGPWPMVPSGGMTLRQAIAAGIVRQTRTGSYIVQGMQGFQSAATVQQRFPAMPGPAFLPAPPSAVGTTGLATRGAVLAKGFALQAAELTAVILAVGEFSKAIDDATTSEKELAAESHLTEQGVDALQRRFGEGAALFHPFSSMTDKVREAGGIIDEIWKDARESGMGYAETQRLINENFEAASQDLGGLTGSLDTLDENLRARLGLLEYSDAVSLLTRRWEAAIEAGKTAGGMDQPRPLFTTFEAQELVAAMMSVERSGLDVTQVLGPMMRDALEENLVTWDQLVSIYKRAGLTMPYKEAGQFAEAIFRVGDASHEQRQRLADFIDGIHDAGIELTAGQEASLGAKINLGLLGEAYDDLGRNVFPALTEHFIQNSDALKDNQVAMLANALASRDYLRYLELIEKFERRRARREFAADRPSGAVGADMRANMALIDNFLDKRKEMASWGDTLRDALELPRLQFIRFGQMVELAANMGMEWKDLSRATRRKITLDIEAGDTEGAIKRILQALGSREWRRRHRIRVDSNAKDTEKDIKGVQGAAERVENESPYTATFDVNTEQARAEVEAFRAYMSNPINAQAFVTVHTQRVHGQMGGWVPGAGAGDRIPMLLEPREFIVRRGVAERYGRFLERLNAGGEFYRPVAARERVSVAAGVTQERGAASRDLHVHVAGRMDYRPEDLRRNLEGWWKRRGW